MLMSLWTWGNILHIPSLLLNPATDSQIRVSVGAFSLGLSAGGGQRYGLTLLHFPYESCWALSIIVFMNTSGKTSGQYGVGQYGVCHFMLKIGVLSSSCFEMESTFFTCFLVEVNLSPVGEVSISPWWGFAVMTICHLRMSNACFGRIESELKTMFSTRKKKA